MNRRNASGSEEGAVYALPPERYVHPDPARGDGMRLAVHRDPGPSARSDGALEALRDSATRRHDAETLLARENRILELIASGAPLERVLGTLCTAIEDLIPNSRCGLRLVRGRGSAGGGDAGGTSGPVLHVDTFGFLLVSSAIPAVHHNRVVVEDVHARRLPMTDVEALRLRGIRSYWSEPVVASSGEVLGTLSVYRTDAEPPRPAALESSAALARLAAIAIERARSEERARQQLAQLAHVARLATMGEMASGLAHELNQPLCAIVNFTEACLELINNKTAEPAELQRAIGEVAKQAERAGQVIRRLRDFVRRREPQRVPVDLNAVVRDVVALTEVEVRHSETRVRLWLTKRLPRVLADPIQIQQVLVNLVRNALDAMKDTEVSRKLVTIQTSRRNGAVEITVADNGPGIPEELRGRLFEPFFSTKPEGMGMGLSISRSILEVHEGRIWVSPGRSGGAKFRFSLPTVRRTQHGRIANCIRGG